MVPGAGLPLVAVLSAGPHDFQAGTGGSRRRAGEALMSGHTHHTPGVVMFVMNDLLNDPRVQREARSAGFGRGSGPRGGPAKDPGSVARPAGGGVVDDAGGL